MEDLRRRSALSFSFILCFSLWLRPGETFWYQCLDECPVKYFTSTYGLPCKDGCEKRGYDYYWCRSRAGWDYCSPGENIDYQGNTCSDPCGGASYNWCKLWGGSWGYCGRVEPRAMTYYTRYGKECIEECRLSGLDDYFWCITGDKWEYCSPLQDHTYKNEPCRSNHPCGSYGYSYTWCYTTYNNDWDYCGVISTGECVFTQTTRAKRQTNNPRVICTREDNNNNNNNNNNNRRVTTFKDMGGQKKIKEPTNREKKDALELINRWNNQRLSDVEKSSLLTYSNLRLDHQGPCHNSNNQRCYNLQIQINKPRNNRESTTLAQITVPFGTSADYMRLALKESLMGGFNVEVEVNDVPTPPPNNYQKCCKRKKKKDYNSDL